MSKIANMSQNADFLKTQLEANHTELKTALEAMTQELALLRDTLVDQNNERIEKPQKAESRRGVLSSITYSVWWVVTSVLGVMLGWVWTIVWTAFSRLLWLALGVIVVSMAIEMMPWKLIGRGICIWMAQSEGLCQILLD